MEAAAGYGGVAAEPADVLPAARAHGAHRLVGGVVRHLGKDSVVHLLRLAADEGQEGVSREPRRTLHVQEVAEGGVDVHVRHHGVADPASREPARPAHDEHDADAVVGEVALGAWEGDAVVGGADDEGVRLEARLAQGIEHHPHAGVQQARAGVKCRHVGAHGGRIGERGRRTHIARVGIGLGELAVRLGEPHGEEERLGRRVPQPRGGGRRDVLGVVAGHGHDLVIADDLGPGRDVLHADERRPIAGIAQRVR